MGRTLPSAAIVFQQEAQNFDAFKRAMSRRDRLALEELFVFANQHIAEAAYAANPLPMETFLLSMLLEVHKEVMRLRTEIEPLTETQSPE